MTPTNDKWLLALLRDAEEKDWCTKISCTTCGAADFRKALWKNLTSDLPGLAQKEVIAAIVAVTDEGAQTLDAEKLFWTLGLIFHEVGLWSPSGKAGAERPSALEGTWADMFFTRITPEIAIANRRRGHV